LQPTQWFGIFKYCALENFNFSLVYFANYANNLSTCVSQYACHLNIMYSHSEIPHIILWVFKKICKSNFVYRLRIYLLVVILSKYFIQIGMNNQTETSTNFLALYTCFVIDLQSGRECSSVNSSNCIECPTKSGFLTGEAVTEFGGLGHLITFIIWILALVVGIIK